MRRTIVFKRPGFTLIELLVVVVIIGILATLATVMLSGARAKARDAKRIADVKQIQTALELYFAEENSYPSTGAVLPGLPIVSADGSKTYLKSVPSNPEPRSEGGCVTSADYSYSQQDGGRGYALNYCLAKSVNGLPAGSAMANQKAIHNACTPNCSGKCGGADNGCGGGCNDLSGCGLGQSCNNQSCCAPTDQVSACADKCAGTVVDDGCGGSYTCASSPAVPTVTGVVAVANSNNQITVSWSAVSGATQYRVYGDTNNSTNLLGTVSSTNFIHSGLAKNSAHYYRVKAVVCGVASTNYSSQVSITTQNNIIACPNNPTVSYYGESGTNVNYDTVFMDYDNDGVQDSGECWFKDNLRTNKTPSGVALSVYACPPNTSNTSSDCTAVAGSYKLGYLYTGTTIMNGSTLAGAQGICPSGWHVPTISEYQALISYNGGTSSCLAETYWRCESAGLYLKAASTWNTYNSGVSGFDLKASGFVSGGSYAQRGTSAYLAASDATGSYIAAISFTDLAGSGSNHTKINQTSAFSNYVSVRCVK